MTREFPKWAQPMFTETPYCSVCNSADVYFEMLDSWVEKTEFQGKTFLINNWAMKRYCKDCFEEYGGSVETYPNE